MPQLPRDLGDPDRARRFPEFEPVDHAGRVLGRRAGRAIRVCGRLQEEVSPHWRRSVEVFIWSFFFFFSLCILGCIEGGELGKEIYPSRLEIPGMTIVSFIPSGSTSYINDSASPSTAHFVAQYAF